MEATVQAPVEKVWACWAEPRHITNWCFASEVEMQRAGWQAILNHFKAYCESSQSE